VPQLRYNREGKNKMTRFCLGGILAAGVASATLQGATFQVNSRRVTSVVRADASGRLVRAVVVSPRVVHENVIAPRQVSDQGQLRQTAAITPPGSLREMVDQAAERHSLPPQLIHSVIKVESNYNTRAVSPKGALGIMQLVPSTALRFGVGDVFNAKQNIEGGVRYLRYLVNMFGGNYGLALAAYNAGEGAVVKYGGIPPYPETVSYLTQVRRRLAELKLASEPEKPKPVQTEIRPPGTPNSIREVVEPDGRVHYVTR
jgi:soluble lytic murein transglycosylase-like protein